jgi:hypothetical protein
MKYFHKVERTWQEAYSNKEEMCALINGWERWEPEGDLKKGKELLSTNWRKAEMNKKANGRREGGENNNNDDSDDNDDYHSDKYNDLEEFHFRLDDANLRKVTGLNNEIAGEDACEMGDESNDEEDGAGENGDNCEEGWMWRMEESGKGDRLDVRIGEDKRIWLVCGVHC